MRKFDEINLLLVETESELSKLNARRDELLGKLPELQRERVSLLNEQEALPQPKLPPLRNVIEQAPTRSGKRWQETDLIEPADRMVEK